MTITAAIRRNDEIYIGADSFAGSDLQKNPHIISNKLIKFKSGAYIGISGLFLLRDVLEERRDKDPYRDFSNKHEVRDFIKDVWVEMKDILSSVENTERLVSTNAIIATPKRIWEINIGDLSLLETNKYTTTGSGYIACQAALEALYDTEMSTKALLEKSLKITTKIVPTTSPPIKVIKVSV